MATSEKPQEVFCPNAQKAEALHSIKHRPALLLKDNRLFLERAWNSAFVVWQKDGSIVLVDEKNPARADGYDASSIREVFTWCAHCNRNSVMNYRRNEEDKQLKEFMAAWEPTGTSSGIEFPKGLPIGVRLVARDAQGTTVAEVEGDRSDYFAILPFEVFSYPSLPENSLLKKCWDKAWKFGFDAFPDNTLEAFVGLSEDDRKAKGHEIRMSRRYDLSIGRNAFKSLFTEHLDDVRTQLQEYQGTAVDSPEAKG